MGGRIRLLGQVEERIMEERRGSMATIEHEGRPSTSLSASLIHLLVAFEGGVGL